MDVTQIPFVKHAGIFKNEEGRLIIVPRDEITNHIDTIHASVQFTLAETQSGEILQSLFPQYVGKVVGLLRDAKVKYKKPAITALTAHAVVTKVAKKKCIKQMNNKGRAIIVVEVSVKDMHNVVTMQGEFTWFIQKIEKSERF